MISFKLQVILIASSLLCVVLLINLLSRYRLELKYSILWIAVVVLLFILSIFPKVFSFFSESLGIELPVNALFLFSIFGLICISFSATLEISKANNKIKDLTQEIGIMKRNVEMLSIQLKLKSEDRDVKK
ncbi:hypothetical protein PVOR_31479 [Paenibacillus vortex V453]|uniref:DUF2304 domain-containing protein n=1 Tax=Paenibacillus vortex V453 TaxID=715225 RepID=A0A2R9SL86_9BACL|nr:MULTISPECIES: DUF2304 domain-containing protein [Paenibacillus]AWP25485.1 hypothetical protein B9D94_01995 [Paenibacillus sp. Cedars]EFU38124.1 hypothetical protein PVOR_31479 [Paenibacillus vortex V453]